MSERRSSTSPPTPASQTRGARSGAGAATPGPPRHLDWRMILMGLPTRRFTLQELQRAIPEPPSTALRIAVVANVLLTLMVLPAAFGARAFGPMLGMLLPFALLLLVTLRAIWRDPSGPVVRWIYYGLPLIGLALGLLSRELADAGQPEMLGVLAVSLTSAVALWFVILYRHQHVAMRLRELDEQARAVAMARRLSAAQIQPHFLFNALASLQHWVHEKDDRAAPMLDALTGYLRATLPMFDRETLPLAEELAAARRYLEVMQLRLGPRLSFSVQADADIADAPLVPGVVLTLLENALEHGVQPSLRGGHVAVRASRDGTQLNIVVADDGVGLDPGAAEGLGLRNIRQRLAQCHGAAAGLRLDGAPGRGCRAVLHLPLPVREPT